MTLRFTVRALLIGLWLAACGFAVFGQEHKVTLVGKLFQVPDAECSFFLDPTGDSEGIQTFTVLPGEYLCDYLKGSDGRPFVVILQPGKP